MRRFVAFRLAMLTVVNGAILCHVYLYYVQGNTSVGCMDFYGLTSAVAQGRVTAGTLLVVGALLVTLAFGRLFCGWGCHFALFQDITSWVVDRLGWRLPFRESRVQWILPPLLLLVTIGMPILKYWSEHGTPTQVTMDLSYPEVWHLLPGWKGSILMLVVDAVVLTLIFGKRAFCRYLCPYGLLLKAFHAVSPTRVVKRNACTDCGQCASACPTGVPIKFEIERYGLVRDLNCMNCGDCIPACPTGALALRPARSTYSTLFEAGVRGARRPLWSDVILLTCSATGWALYRGAGFGDFLALGMGLVAGAALVTAISPRRYIRPRWLAGPGFLTNHARTFAAAVAGYMLLGMVGQGVAMGTIAAGHRLVNSGEYEPALRTFSMGSATSGLLTPFTFYLDDFADRAPSVAEPIYETANAQLESGHWNEAETLYRIVLRLDPDRTQAYGNLGTTLYKQHRFWEAARCYLRVLDTDPHDLIALYHLAMTRTRLGDLDSAANLVREIVSIDTAGSMYELISSNPELLPVRESAKGRRLLEMYRMTHNASPAGG